MSVWEYTSSDSEAYSLDKGCAYKAGGYLGRVKERGAKRDGDSVRLYGVEKLFRLCSWSCISRNGRGRQGRVREQS